MAPTKQLFSYLTFIKNNLRSCLKLYHLIICLRAGYTVPHCKTLKGFPYMKAFCMWHSKRKRRAAELTAVDNI